MLPWRKPKGIGMLFDFWRKATSSIFDAKKAVNSIREFECTRRRIKRTEMKEGYLPTAGIYATKKQSQLWNFATILLASRWCEKEILRCKRYSTYNRLRRVYFNIGVKKHQVFLQFLFLIVHNDRYCNEACRRLHVKQALVFFSEFNIMYYAYLAKADRCNLYSMHIRELIN